ncbi:hypothetical protein ACVXHB_31110 [Escherichia coli]
MLAMTGRDVLSGNVSRQPVNPPPYAISLIVVFLCLAALYESWSIALPSRWLFRWGLSVRCRLPHLPWRRHECLLPA